MTQLRGYRNLILISILIGTIFSVFETESWIDEFCTDIEDDGGECDRETRVVAETLYFYHIPYTAALFGFYGFAIASIFYIYKTFTEPVTDIDTKMIEEE